MFRRAIEVGNLVVAELVALVAARLTHGAMRTSLGRTSRDGP
jgi:hypothetical protein